MRSHRLFNISQVASLLLFLIPFLLTSLLSRSEYVKILIPGIIVAITISFFIATAKGTIKDQEARFYLIISLAATFVGISMILFLGITTPTNLPLWTFILIFSITTSLSLLAIAIFLIKCAREYYRIKKKESFLRFFLQGTATILLAHLLI